MVRTMDATMLKMHPEVRILIARVTLLSGSSLLCERRSALAVTRATFDSHAGQIETGTPAPDFLDPEHHT